MGSKLYGDRVRCTLDAADWFCHSDLDGERGALFREGGVV